MMNVVGKLAADELEQLEAERSRRMRIVPDLSSSRSAPSDKGRAPLKSPAGAKHRLDQALVTSAPVLESLTIYRHAPLHRPPQPRPPPYEPLPDTATAAEVPRGNEPLYEPHFLSAGQHSFGSLKHEIARTARRQSPSLSGGTADSHQMKKLLQTRRDAVLHRRSQQRARAQQLATAVEARVDKVARSSWQPHSQRQKQSPAQLLEAEATMRELAVAPHAFLNKTSDRPSLAVRAMRWGTYESPPPPAPPPPPSQQKFRPRRPTLPAEKPAVGLAPDPELKTSPPPLQTKPEISVVGALVASATAAKMLEKHDLRKVDKISMGEWGPEPEPEPEPELQPELKLESHRAAPTAMPGRAEAPGFQPELETDQKGEQEQDQELESEQHQELAAEDAHIEEQQLAQDWVAVAIARRANAIRVRSDAALMIQSHFRERRLRRRRVRTAAPVFAERQRSDTQAPAQAPAQAQAQAQAQSLPQMQTEKQTGEEAVQIQRCFRGWSARRRVALFWLWWEGTIEEDAATKIAALWRGCPL